MHSASQWNVSRTVGGRFVPSGVICSTTRRCPLRTTSPTPVVSDRSSRRVRGASPTNARSSRRTRPPPSAPLDSELRFEATRDFLSSEVARLQSWRASVITMVTEPVAWAVFKVRTISGDTRPASSTITTVSAFQPNICHYSPRLRISRIGPELRRHLHRYGCPSPSITSAALPVRTSPRTVFPGFSHALRVVSSEDVLPAQAGATTTQTLEVGGAARRIP